MRKFSLICLSLSVILSLGFLVSAPVAFTECIPGPDSHVFYGKTTLGVQYSQEIDGVWDEWTVAGNAKSDSETVKGKIQARSNGEYGSFRGKVTCFFRCDNIAWFSGPAKYTNNESGTNLVGFVFIVQDNGEPGKGVDGIQLRLLDIIPDDLYCSAIPGPGLFTESLINRGNIRVSE